jgi:hypothetical protein
MLRAGGVAAAIIIHRAVASSLYRHNGKLTADFQHHIKTVRNNLHLSDCFLCHSRRQLAKPAFFTSFAKFGQVIRNGPAQIRF